MQSTLRQVPQRKTFGQWALQSEGLAKEFQERVGEELSTAHSAILQNSGPERAATAPPPSRSPTTSRNTG